MVETGKPVIVKDKRNSETRRRNNLHMLAESGRLTVIYNGSVKKERLEYVDGRGFCMSSDGTYITEDCVYAINPGQRTITLRLRNTRGIAQ